MKKLLIFVLVACLASMASATVVLDLHDGTEDRVDIVATGETGCSSWYLTIDTAGSMDAGTMVYTGTKKAISTVTDTDILAVLDAAMDAAPQGNGGPHSDADFVEFQDTSGPPPLAPSGISAYYIVTLSGPSAWLYLHNSETGAVVSALEIVPEPATMALLGLGALFALRRRK